MVDLFTPGRIGQVELKNRLVRSATWEALATDGGKVTDKLIANVKARIEGGVGLFILGITSIAPEGKGMPNMTGIHHDDHIDGHARLTEAVHQASGRISIQLAHVGGQTDRKSTGGLEPAGPSAVLNPAFNVTPRALSTDEVKKLIDGFGRAAARAIKAGYDLIQLHGAHGYLIDQFLSPRFNRRDDEYGEPARFLMDAYRAVHANAGSAPVHVKLSLDDFLEGSTTTEISLPAAKALSAAGIDAIEVSAGTPASGKLGAARVGIKTPADEAYLLGLARQVKQQVSCPVISVGGWRSPEVINRALAAGEVDFVSMARPFIREPGLVKRWAGGDHSAATCISCNRCFGTLKYGDGIQCKVELKARLKLEDD